MEGERFQDIPVSLAMSTRKLSEMKVEDNPGSSESKEKEERKATRASSEKTVEESFSEIEVPTAAPISKSPEAGGTTSLSSPPAAKDVSRGKATKRGNSEDTSDLRIENPEIHMQQYPPNDDLDIEIDKLVYVVEDHAHALKKSLVNRYMGMRKKWHDHEIQRIEDEKRIFERELVNKQAELDRERYALHQQKQNEAKAKRVTMKAIGMIFISNQRLKNFSTCATFFKIWRDVPKKRRLFHKSLDKIKMKFALQIMKRHFMVWRKWTRENVRTRIEEVIFHRFEKKFNDERVDLQGQIVAYKSELEAVRKELEDAMTAREKIEKDMKQSFMRGLCAMNIEAMSMMKKGSFNSLSAIIDSEEKENVSSDTL